MAPVIVRIVLLAATQVLQVISRALLVMLVLTQAALVKVLALFV